MPGCCPNLHLEQSSFHLRSRFSRSESQFSCVAELAFGDIRVACPGSRSCDPVTYPNSLQAADIRNPTVDGIMMSETLTAGPIGIRKLRLHVKTEDPAGAGHSWFVTGLVRKLWKIGTRASLLIFNSCRYISLALPASKHNPCRWLSKRYRPCSASKRPFQLLPSSSCTPHRPPQCPSDPAERRDHPMAESVSVAPRTTIGQMRASVSMSVTLISIAQRTTMPLSLQPIACIMLTGRRGFKAIYSWVYRNSAPSRAPRDGSRI